CSICARSARSGSARAGEQPAGARPALARARGLPPRVRRARRGAAWVHRRVLLRERRAASRARRRPDRRFCLELHRGAEFRAAAGEVRGGALAGLCVGLLFLARAEGALFGVALLWLAVRPGSRGAGLAGSLVALAIGGAWLARGVSLGASPDLMGRTALLAR